MFVISIVKQSIPLSKLCLAFMSDYGFGSARVRVSGNGLRRLIPQAFRILIWLLLWCWGKTKICRGEKNDTCAFEPLDIAPCPQAEK